MTVKGWLVACTLLCCSCAYAASADGSLGIGTISVRGNVRVDGYTVQSNGTLFDGTAVETDQASATLRLENGTEVMMSTNSRGIVHSDGLVLLQGRSELKSTNSPFFLEADGLRIKPSGPNSVGEVLVNDKSHVEVAAITGEFLIVDDSGSPLVHIAPGTSMDLHQDGNGAQAAGAASTPASADGTLVTEVGLVSKENGQFYLTTTDGTKYQLVGKDFAKVVGDKVVVNGKLQEVGTATVTSQGATAQIDVRKMNINGAGYFSTAGLIWFWSAMAGFAAGLGYAVYEATKSASP
jgi:hypothetical protein